MRVQSLIKSTIITQEQGHARKVNQKSRSGAGLTKATRMRHNPVVIRLFWDQAEKCIFALGPRFSSVGSTTWHRHSCNKAGAVGQGATEWSLRLKADPTGRSVSVVEAFQHSHMRLPCYQRKKEALRCTSSKLVLSPDRWTSKRGDALRVSPNGSSYRFFFMNSCR